jgi:hypothetical protein
LDCKRIRHAIPIFAAMALTVCTILGCSEEREPGSPPGEPSPLFDGYKSYRTLDQVKNQLPDRSTWQILANSNRPARNPCSRFDELTVTVAAVHLAQTGRLQLTFINDRLEATSFTPEDFPAYVEALRRSGVPFQADGRATIPPSTRVWQSDEGRSPRFVGWDDERFAAQVNAWVSRCT